MSDSVENQTNPQPEKQQNGTEQPHEYVTKAQLAATLKLWQQLMADHQQHPSSQDIRESKQTQQQPTEELAVLQRQLQQLKSETEQSKLNSAIAEAVSKAGLLPEAVTYLQATLGGQLQYGQELGQFYSQKQQRSLDELVVEFANTDLGKRMQSQQKPVVPQQGQLLGATNNTSKPSAADLLAQAFQVYVK